MCACIYVGRSVGRQAGREVGCNAYRVCHVGHVSESNGSSVVHVVYAARVIRYVICMRVCTYACMYACMY